MTQKVVHPIHARDGEFVDVHWHTAAGTFVQRISCPPQATREARGSQKAEEAEETLANFREK